MSFRLVPAMILVAVLLSGCGGGGGGNNNPPPPGVHLARISTTVNWPARSRDITALSSALSITVVMQGASENGTDFVWVINRGTNAAAFSQKYISTVTAKVGAWNATIKLYTLAGGQGSVVGEANAVATIADDGSGFPTLSIATKITRVTVATNRNIPVGQTKDIPFTTTDANGNVVPVTAGSAIWQVVAGQSSLTFVNGSAQGLANGTATVKATVDGVTSDATFVTVGPLTGTLTVNVKDPTGTLVPKATVTLVQSGVQVKQNTTATGTVTFSAIAQGATDVKVTVVGFHDGQATATVVTSPTPVVDVTVAPAGTPVATNLATRLVSASGNAATFETDLAVTDESGQAITTLDPSTFLIDPIAIGGSALTFQQNSAALVDADSHAGFSAFLANDATESMGGADPTRSRIEGMKAFYGLMPAGSNAAFGYFPDASGSTNLKTYPSIGFVGNGSAYYAAIDSLATVSLAGTPLYNATTQAIDLTGALNGNANRAVVVLTDGHQTTTGATLASTVSDAKSKNIRVFTVRVGLTQTNYMNDFAELAQRTGGGTALATDSLQLTSFYKSLPALLMGNIKVYRVRWTVIRDAGDFPVGSTVATMIKIPQSDGVLLAPFFIQVN